MKYKGLYIDITPCDDLVRNDSSGNDVVCRGYRMSVFRDEAMTEKFDEFTAAVGYEILAEDMEEAKQFANSLKTEIFMTMNFREWRHFFKLRCSKAAHPQMQQIANMILDLFREKYPLFVLIYLYSLHHRTVCGLSSMQTVSQRRGVMMLVIVGEQDGIYMRETVYPD